MDPFLYKKPDPLESLQWQLAENDAGGLLNLPSLHDAYTGKGVRVGVVDDGFHIGHRDLAEAFAQTGAWDHREGDADASAGSFDYHGTLVAGLIAGRRNGYGVVGAAPDSIIEAHRIGFGAAPVLVYERALQSQRHVDVSNNSWGFTQLFQDNFRSAIFSGLGVALEEAATQGRGGLGTVMVFAAGNGASKGDDVNAHNLQNSRFVITVAGASRSGEPLPDGRPGAAILVAAPGAELLTTDAPGSAGKSAGDHAVVSGSSFAAPLVSATAALMLEANPALGYRDIQIILAAAARSSVTKNGDFAPTGGSWLNGGGPTFSHRLGFGVVDAAAAVRLAEAWTRPRTEADVASAMVALAEPRLIPERGKVAVAFTVDASLWLERVALDLSIEHGWIGELKVTLISPAGTPSVLLNRAGARPDDATDGGTSRKTLEFTFTSVAPMGENTAGNWTLLVEDLGFRGAGELKAGRISFYGTAASDERTAVQVFTDEFFHRSNAEAAILRGQPGRDSLLAAALSESATIDIRPGGISLIAGRPVVTEGGSLIDDVTGGAGSDQLFGNGFANALRGESGHDRIVGRNGDDTLVGGTGNDTLVGGNGADVLEGGPEDDILRGDAGGDRFVYRVATADLDTILDFTVGEDKLDLSALGLARGDVMIEPGRNWATVSFSETVVRLNGVDAEALSAAFSDSIIL